MRTPILAFPAILLLVACSNEADTISNNVTAEDVISDSEDYGGDVTAIDAATNADAALIDEDVPGSAGDEAVEEGGGDGAE